MKTWISRKVSYFVGILSEVEDIFSPDYPQVFSLLNIGFRDISEAHKNLVWKGKSFYR